MLMHHFGSGICSQIRWRTGIIFMATRPATIIRSHCRGLNRITSAPNRAMSNRLAPTAISSMPQQAVANGIGQRLYLRHQLDRVGGGQDRVLGDLDGAGRLRRSAFEPPVPGRRGRWTSDRSSLSPFEDPLPPGVGERRRQDRR